MSRRACFRVLILANPALATCGGQGTFSWIQRLQASVPKAAGWWASTPSRGILSAKFGFSSWRIDRSTGLDRPCGIRSNRCRRGARSGPAYAAHQAVEKAWGTRSPASGPPCTGRTGSRRHRRRWKIDGGCWVATPCSRPCERQTIALQHLELGGQQIEAGGHQRHAIGADLRNAHPADGQSPEEGHLDAVAVRG